MNDALTYGGTEMNYFLVANNECDIPVVKKYLDSLGAKYQQEGNNFYTNESSAQMVSDKCDEDALDVDFGVCAGIDEEGVEIPEELE